MSPHGRPARFAQAESEKLLANTWPRAGESSWILSLIYFSRPEGHLLGTYGHFRVLVLHLFRLSGAMHQPRLFSKMTSPSNHCVMWIWDVHKRVPSFHKIPSHGSIVFSVVSSYYILKTILFWILPFQSLIPLMPEKPWAESLLSQIQHHLWLDIVWWPVTLYCKSHRTGQLLFAIINELTNISSLLRLT